MSPSAVGLQAASLVFYSLPNFAGTTRRVSHVEISPEETFAIICGARGYCRGAGEVQTGQLIALDPQTLLPIPVVWRYRDDVNYIINTNFIDTQPDRYLEVVNLAGEVITLNVFN